MYTHNIVGQNLIKKQLKKMIVEKTYPQSQVLIDNNGYGGLPLAINNGLNLIYGLVFGITWIIIFLVSKYSSLSSLIGSLSMPIINYFIFNDEIIFFIIMFVLIFYTHRENIKRLLNRTESKTKIY